MLKYHIILEKFFEKKHSCGFIFQNWSIYISTFEIQKIYIIFKYVSDELAYCISTFKHVSNLRHRAHAQKCKALLHCTESLERDDTEILGLQIKDEHNC